MKVVVFGASGKTGSLVVEKAVAAGHTVTAFVHEGSTIKQQNVEVIVGDVNDSAAVRFALQGKDAVIDAIGGKTPYKETDLESAAVRHIVDAMHETGARRLVVISALGVGDSGAQAPFWYEYLMKPTFLRGSSKDKAAMESAVQASGLQFVIARPPILTDDPPTNAIKIVTGDATAHKITRADLAQFLVEQLTTDAYLGQFVVVANS